MLVRALQWPWHLHSRVTEVLNAAPTQPNLPADIWLVKSLLNLSFVAPVGFPAASTCFTQPKPRTNASAKKGELRNPGGGNFPSRALSWGWWPIKSVLRTTSAVSRPSRAGGGSGRTAGPTTLWVQEQLCPCGLLLDLQQGQGKGKKSRLILFAIHPVGTSVISWFHITILSGGESSSEAIGEQ